MASFHSLPNEILRLIFWQCDSFSQLVSLARSCKRLYELYMNDMHSIMYPFAQRHILNFDDAWVTVRATRKVVKCYASGRLPQNPLKLRTLRPPGERITLDDMKDISEWDHLLDCIENTLLTDASVDVTGLEVMRHRANWTALRRNLRRSIYRLFLIGAVLCPTYQEPFQTTGRNVPAGFLEDCAYRLVKDGVRVLVEDEIQHLLTYPVLNRTVHYNAYGPDFDVLVDYLVAQARSRAQRETPTSPMYPPEAVLNGVDSNTGSILYAETVQCILAYYLVVCNRTLFTRQMNDLLPTRKVTAVFMDSFLPEEIFMPDSSRTRDLLRYRELPAGATGGWGTPSRFLNDLLRYLFVSLVRRGLGSNPPLQIFQVLRDRFFGLRFSAEIVHGFLLMSQGNRESIAQIYADEWSDGVEDYWRR
ncbi:predicted protein [Aspergillus terreus NIH2624]|uniref:F-box domain-containing protein n=1 Tax=Aspergillus terreus (strain NIH 2624 / FGSC A1156) TaxID=341663 RepID=Q0CS69_ASPTN|nr:uncharacterized protein ATEG_03465 [Aspergillus terreus NIH2624]EAU36739.1 predicted protein [Aspergillus terreus NIH2624]